MRLRAAHGAPYRSEMRCVCDAVRQRCRTTVAPPRSATEINLWKARRSFSFLMSWRIALHCSYAHLENTVKNSSAGSALARASGARCSGRGRRRNADPPDACGERQSCTEGGSHRRAVTVTT